MRRWDEQFELNRAAWDERTGIHVGSAFYDNESFKAGRSTIRRFELDEVGAVEGKTLCHLQCHFGQDTISWARLGAAVVGVDFSEAAVRAARRLAAELGVPAEFCCSNVYSAAQVVGHRTFDIVYTGLGALCWLPDIEEWARVCASLVAPGGIVYLAEFHPFTEILADDDLVVVRDYFTKAEGTAWTEPGTYTDRDAETQNNTTYEWTHPISAVVDSLVATGLRLELFHEHDITLFERWPFLEPQDDFTWRMPRSRPRIPLIYSLRMRRPVS